MRMNWKRLGGIAGAAAFILTLAVVGSSQGPQGPPGGGFPGGFGGPGARDGLGPLTRDLKLTDEQKAQIKKITESFVESTKSLHEQMKASFDDETDPFSTAFDEAAVRATAEARAKIEVELAVARAKMTAQIAAVLTPEQKAQLVAKRARFGERPEGPPPQ